LADPITGVAHGQLSEAPLRELVGAVLLDDGFRRLIDA
jgi:hypothetical protein